ncbi:MAG TPA: chemotaxis protein CheX [Phycisphaerae bacterium]|nr:chemotaxis protein CheX [Phycisphaerae bacterium]HRW53452.1 chemotaxis protein CheX [Phycisphaerae bacterium]
MDVKFVNAFVGSILNVFKTMMSIDVKVGKPSLKEAELVTAEVSGIIGLSGEVQGSVILSFDMPVACAVASTFAGAELNPDSADFTDAIGELANMVAGNAKKDFHGYDASISLPSVIIGKGHRVSQSKVWPFLVIPCETKLGKFNVEVALITKKAPATVGV